MIVPASDVSCYLLSLYGNPCVCLLLGVEELNQRIKAGFTVHDSLPSLLDRTIICQCQRGGASSAGSIYSILEISRYLVQEKPIFPIFGLSGTNSIDPCCQYFRSKKKNIENNNINTNKKINVFCSRQIFMYQ